MHCPACGSLLNKISVTTNQGGRFEVDHCGICGGTWFDPYEINRIPVSEIMSLAKSSVISYGKKKNQNSSQRCPNDHLELAPFKGEAVPRGVRLLWCRRCLGIWAMEKDLWEFKKRQEETVSAYDEGNKFFPSLSAVFVPVVTFVLLLAATFTTISTLQDRREQRIMAESQITGLQTISETRQSVIISFNTAGPVSSRVLYGQSTLEMKEEIISQDLTTSHSLFIPNLAPDSDYIYRLRLTDEFNFSYESDLKFFKTR